MELIVVRCWLGFIPVGTGFTSYGDQRVLHKLPTSCVKKWNAQILLFAGPNERQLQAQVANLMHQQPIFVKEDDLCQIAGLIAACDFYIGNDTGPMHIAVAVGTPVVAIFGSTNHHRSGPYGEEHIVVHSGVELGCNPCHPR